MSACPDCGGIRRRKDRGWWCSWCKVEERELNVKNMLQDEWDRK
jgi:hypothetical protein